jgi:prepilin-type processing-associated H-X9-DG protein
LVELIVVAGIIAVLVGILLSSTAAARREARAVQCQSNIRQLAAGMIAYAGGWHGRFPPNLRFGNAQFWCEDARIGSFVPLPPSGRANTSTVYACPEDESPYRSYAMNVWASSKLDPVILAPPVKGVRWKTGVREACRMILLIEAWSYVGSDTAGYSPQPFVGADSTPGRRLGGEGGITPFNGVRWGMLNCEVTYARHRRHGAAGSGTQPKGRTSIAFADGHVQMLSNDELVVASTGDLTGAAYWSPLDLP